MSTSTENKKVPNGETLFLACTLRPALLFPFWMVTCLSALSFSVAGVFPFWLAGSLVLLMGLITVTPLKKLFRTTQVGVLLLFTSIYILHPSLVLLLLFTIYFQIVYFWGGKRPVHYLWIAGVGFFQLIVISTVMGSVLFPVVFIIFVVFLTLAFLTADYLRGIEKATGVLDLEELNRCDPQVIRRMRKVSLWIGSLSLILAMVFFPFLPRFQRLSYNPSQATGNSITGFSSQVTLGQMGAIQQDNRVALRVFLPKGFDRRIQRWRGAILEVWNHSTQTWSSGTKSGVTLAVTEQWLDLRPSWLQANNPPMEFPRYDVEVSVSPMADPTLFFPEVDGNFPDTSVRLQCNFDAVSFDDWSWTCDLRDDLVYRGFSYQLQVEPRGDEQQIQKPVKSDHFKRMAFCRSLDGVPQDFINVLTRRAIELVPEYKDHSLDNRTMVRTLTDRLSKAQPYTIDFKAQNSAQSLDDFISNRKAGDCEYFSTTLALMCRGYGIPARLVTGFMGGRANILGNYQVVRQSDAHSWCEVYLEDTGWVCFDATPSDPNATSQWQSEVGYLVDTYDYMQMLWNFYVLDYSQSDQKEFMGYVFFGSWMVFQPIFAGGRLIFYMRRVIALVFFLIFLLWFLHELLPGFGPWWHSLSFRIPLPKLFGWFRQSHHDATRAFMKIEREWTRKGFPRNTAETATHYLNRLSARFPDKSPLFHGFLMFYLRFRFGQDSMNSEDNRMLSEMVFQLLRIARTLK